MVVMGAERLYVVVAFLWHHNGRLAQQTSSFFFRNTAISFNTYSMIKEGINNNASYNTYANYRSALRLPLSGNFLGGSAREQGSYCRFWSSTRRDDNRMYYLYLTPSLVYPVMNDPRNYGYSVRCVLGSE